MPSKQLQTAAAHTHTHTLIHTPLRRIYTFSSVDFVQYALVAWFSCTFHDVYGWTFDRDCGCLMLKRTLFSLPFLDNFFIYGFYNFNLFTIVLVCKFFNAQTLACRPNSIFEWMCARVYLLLIIWTASKILSDNNNILNNKNTVVQLAADLNDLTARCFVVVVAVVKPMNDSWLE